MWDVTLQWTRWGSEEKDFYSHIPCGMWQISIPMETYNKHFYSHIPCGMWRNIHTKFETIMEFLLTHPVWDVTLSVHLIYATLIISTHTSRVGCDLNVSFVFHNVTNFYSHIPCGMWLYASKLRLRAITFLLTHPVWDVTCPLSSYSCICQFLLTHPVWDVTLFRWKMDGTM